MTTPVNGNSQLSQTAFLQLMVAQMKYQDPLQPQSNSQFMAQLAQFSTLQQMTTLAQTDSQVLQTLSSIQTMDSLNLAHQMLGTQVQVTDTSGSTLSGNISAVKMVNGEPQVVVNGQPYPLTSIVQMG